MAEIEVALLGDRLEVRLVRRHGVDHGLRVLGLRPRLVVEHEPCHLAREQRVGRVEDVDKVLQRAQRPSVGGHGAGVVVASLVDADGGGAASLSVSSASCVSARVGAADHRDELDAIPVEEVDLGVVEQVDIGGGEGDADGLAVEWQVVRRGHMRPALQALPACSTWPARVRRRRWRGRATAEAATATRTAAATATPMAAAATTPRRRR